MRAMILAAGRGSRLRPITDQIPKPLVTVGGISLIEWHLRSLKKVDVLDVVINVAWLGQKIQEFLGDGSRFGVHIHYSKEGKEGLETAGGVRFAADLLGPEPFLVLNGDIWTDYPLSRLMACAAKCTQETPAFLVSIPNPKHHPEGDFCVDVSRETWGLVPFPDHVSRETMTFSGMALYHPSFFSSVGYGEPCRLKTLLEQHVRHHRVFGEVYQGAWFDVGTPDRLQKTQDYVEKETKRHGIKADIGY